MRRLRTICSVGIAGLLLGGLATLPGSTARADSAAEDLVSDVAELPQNVHYPLDSSVGPTLDAWRRTVPGAAQFNQRSGVTPAVGSKRMWLSLDQVKGIVYTK